MLFYFIYKKNGGIGPPFLNLQFTPIFQMAPGVGFEPTTNRLTADDSTAELPRN